MPGVVAVIAVVGPDAAAVAADAGPDVRERPIDDPGDADWLVALGRDAVAALARRGVSAPVLPVEAGRGLRSVPRDSVPAALDALRDGAATVVDRPLFSVRCGETETRAAFEVLLAAELPTLSEYSVTTVDAAGRALPVHQFRADGVAVATPAGSHGYAHDAGGARLSPGVEGAAVVPVAPFSIDRDHWVLALPVRVVVEREEAVVRLRVDGEDRGVVQPGVPVEIDRAGSLPTAVVPAGIAPFGSG